MGYYGRSQKFYHSPYKRQYNKYGNQQREYNGIAFDSKAEMLRYIQLKNMEDSGEIFNLRMQVPYILQPSFKYNGHMIRAIKYVADFVYYDKTGIQHVEDVKGVETKEYMIKRKMMLSVHGICIEEPNKSKAWWDNSKK